jgi:predicted homoserine dehydrogenase-like protein
MHPPALRTRGAPSPRGKHIVTVDVEADVLAGVALAREAARAGVAYSLAYGDQPALICELNDDGGACVWGKLLPASASSVISGLPIGLAKHVKLRGDVPTGQSVTWDDAGSYPPMNPFSSAVPTDVST